MNLKDEKSGIWMDLENGFLAASPDGSVYLLLWI